jgi:hypothetical protein
MNQADLPLETVKNLSEKDELSVAGSGTEEILASTAREWNL